MPSSKRLTKRKLDNLQDAAAKCVRIDSMFRQSQNRDSSDTSIAVIQVECPASELSVTQSECDETVASDSCLNTESLSESCELPIPSQNGNATPHARVMRTKIHTVKSWGYDDWLGYDSDNINGIVCKVWCKTCRQYYKGSDLPDVNKLKGSRLCDLDAYVTGTSNVKKDTAKSHMNSKLHFTAVLAMQPIDDSATVQQLTRWDANRHQQLLKLYDIAYSVAYNEQSFLSFRSQALLEKKHGVDLGENYMHDKACREFIGDISWCYLEKLKAIFQVKPFYCSVLFDGSTDKKLTEKEVISIKLIDNGCPTIKLLGIAEPSSGRADSIYEAIKQKAADVDLCLQDSCVGMAADGASVNFGIKGGVLTMMQREIPWLMKIHCVAHRLELALQVAFKATYYTEIDEMMMNFYYMFHRSAKKWHELQAVAEAMTEVILKPVRAQGTRWIDHRHRGLAVLDRNYSCLVTYFEEVASGHRKDIPPGDQAKMRGYLKRMKSHKFVLHLAFYMDIVDNFADLSLSLQDDKLSLATVRNTIEATMLELRAKLDQDSTVNCGPRIRKIMADVTEESMVYRGHTLNSSTECVFAFQKQSHKVLKSAIDSLDSRFKSFTDDDVLQAADIFDPANLPESKEGLATYGNKEIYLLTQHFEPILKSNDCHIESIPGEWTKLKLDLRRNHAGQAFTEMWKRILQEKTYKYPNVLHIVQILLVAPVATAQVERQFSYLKRFQGDWRLSLQRETLEDLLRVCTEGPDPVDFNPEPAAQRWWAKKTRHRRIPGPICCEKKSEVEKQSEITEVCTVDITPETESEYTSSSDET